MSTFLYFIEQLVFISIDFVNFVVDLCTVPFVSILRSSIDSRILDILLDLITSIFPDTVAYATLLDLVFGFGLSTILAVILVKFFKGVL